MKVYKYELKQFSPPVKVTEYLVECNLNELNTFINEDIIFTFNDEGEIDLLDKDDDFLEIVKTDYIKYEEVNFTKERLTYLYNLFIENSNLKNQLHQNSLSIRNIIEGVVNDK